MRLKRWNLPEAAPPPTAAELASLFDGHLAPTVGLEEEVMVLDADTLDLAPRAREVLEAAPDPRFKRELSAAQLEIVTGACETIAEAAAELAAGRRALAAAAPADVRFATAGAHPFARAEGEVSEQARYRALEDEFGSIVRRQLVFGLHLHVAVVGASRAIPVYNAARSYLPELAALAANAPFHAGGDSGLASVRPTIATLLPRQGVPPPLRDLDELAGALAWGHRAGVLLNARRWWWELRLHPTIGTLEFRVPDAQSGVREAAALGAVAQALVAWLGERHDAGESLPVHPSWRIAENRWLACRHGVEGWLVDLDTGEERPTRALLHGLLDRLAPTAERLGCAGPLETARGLVETNGAARQREAAAPGGLRGVAEWLVERFLDRSEAPRPRGRSQA